MPKVRGVCQWAFRPGLDGVPWWPSRWSPLLRWCFGLLALWLVLKSFPVEVAWYAPILLMAFLAFGTAVPSSVAYTGTYHYAMVTGLAILGVEQNLGVAIAVMAHAIAFLPLMIVAGTAVVVALLRGRYRLPLLSAAEPETATG